MHAYVLDMSSALNALNESERSKMFAFYWNESVIILGAIVDNPTLAKTPYISPDEELKSKFGDFSDPTEKGISLELIAAKRINQLDLLYETL